MKKIIIINEESGEIVAYTTLNGFDSDYLSDEEIIEARIQVAIDDEILEENVWYKYEEVKKIPNNPNLIYI